MALKIAKLSYGTFLPSSSCSVEKQTFLLVLLGLARGVWHFEFGAHLFSNVAANLLPQQESRVFQIKRLEFHYYT